MIAPFSRATASWSWVMDNDYTMRKSACSCKLVLVLIGQHFHRMMILIVCLYIAVYYGHRYPWILIIGRSYLYDLHIVFRDSEIKRAALQLFLTRIFCTRNCIMTKL